MQIIKPSLSSLRRLNIDLLLLLELNYCSSVFLLRLSSVGRFMFPTHLWGRGLFDHVKGSTSIRLCVLILALGRFAIDYLTTQKHSTALDRPARIQSITTICLFGILELAMSPADNGTDSTITPLKNSQIPSLQSPGQGASVSSSEQARLIVL